MALREGQVVALREGQVVALREGQVVALREGQGVEAPCLRPGGLQLTLRGLAHCPWPPNACVVDMGCGQGSSVRHLRSLGFKAIGLDLQSPLYSDFPLVLGRAEAAPFAKGSLQGILCECVLSLLPEAFTVLKNFAALCKQGSALLLSDIYARHHATHPFSRQAIESMLHKTGWRVNHFEDNSSALKDYAAQLLWQGQRPCLPAACGDLSWKECGYGLWTAQKETE